MAATTSRGISIFWKLFIAFLLAALLPLLVTWYYARERSITTSQELADLKLATHANDLADDVDAWLRLNHQSLVEHATTPGIYLMKPEYQKPILQAMQKHQPWTFLVHSINSSGMNVTRSDDSPPISYADRDYFKAVMEGKEIGQQVIVSRTTGKPSVAIAVPVRDDGGRVIGALSRVSALNEVTERLANIRIGRTGKAMIVAPDGKLIAMTGVAQDKDLRDFAKHPAVVAARSGQSVARFDDNGAPIVAQLRKTRFDWIVAVQMDQDEVLDPVRETDRYMLGLLLLALGSAALFAFLVAPTISRPIRRLTAVTEDISRGQFDHELVEVDRRDEIGALARSIDRMTKSLRIAMSKLAERK